MGKSTFNAGGKKSRMKKAKTVDGRQNQRIKKLEQTVYPSIEKKSIDIKAFGAAVSSGGYLNQPMFQLPQGDESNQRIGDKVQLKAMEVSLTLAAQDTTNSVRLIFLHTPSTTAISLDDVLEYVGYLNQPMFQLPQGDESNQRIGDKVQLKAMEVSLTLAAQDTTNSVRLIFLHTPSTTAISLDDVLEYGNYTTDGDMVFSSPYKRKAATAESTYSIMFDKVYHFKSNMRLITDKFLLGKIPKKGRSCNFQSTGSVQPENFQVQLLAVSDSTAAPHPAISYPVRS